jgi:hypothetical protein
MAMPGKKFADVVIARIGGKKPGAMPAAAGDDDEEPDDDDEDDSKPGDRGKIVLAAQRRGDPEAIEEAIKAIVEDCMKEYGVGGK